MVTPPSDRPSEPLDRLLERALASQYSAHALLLRKSVGTVRIVYVAGSRSDFTCAQVSGIETGASGSPAGDSGATAVAMRSLRR